MDIVIYNTQKHRIETVAVNITDKNTTWFDDNFGTDGSIRQITDFKGGIIITKNSYEYPVWIGGVTREEIGHSDQEVAKLLAIQM